MSRKKAAAAMPAANWAPAGGWDCLTRWNPVKDWQPVGGWENLFNREPVKKQRIPSAGKQKNVGKQNKPDKQG